VILTSDPAGTDPQTGSTLSNENIRYQMVTFLIAGHETTSGLLSFAFYHLLRNPEALRKAQAEVDAVTAGASVAFPHLKELRYIDAVLKETMRMQPPVGMFSVKPKDGPYTFKGGYKVDQRESVGILVTQLHRDTRVWGEDVETFRPERMLDGGFEKLPPNSWKPFGNGPRACIGRSFAWQEATLLVARLLQKFHFEMEDPSYRLKIKHTLTVKPLDFFMKARPRTDVTASAPVVAVAPLPAAGPPVPDAGGTSKRIAVFFASNSGE
jgi:cytochrome P450 / NADPH-cytochrome P450 reductase